MIHIVAESVRAGAELADREGGEIFRDKERAAVVGVLVAAAELAGEERVSAAVGVGERLSRTPDRGGLRR